MIWSNMSSTGFLTRRLTCNQKRHDITYFRGFGSCPRETWLYNSTRHKEPSPVSDLGGRRIVLNKALITHLICHFLAHLSKRLICELIVYPWSVVRRSQCSDIFSSETALPIEAKFYVEPPWVWGTKVCSRHLGHMTKMAARPIYGKKPSKLKPSPEPVDRFSRNFICSIGDSCSS